ncbi:unnamed protein product [Ophioblennius macclurei]
MSRGGSVLLLILPPLLLLGCGGAREADLPRYQVVHPTRVDADGRFLSNFLPHHARRRLQRRAAAAASDEPAADQERVFYRFRHAGHNLRFNLTFNPRLLAPGCLTERRYGGLEGARIQTPAASMCHFLGEVWDGTAVRGSAAISACDGLTGLFKLSDEEFFIQPLETWSDDADDADATDATAPQAHAIYKRHAPLVPPISGKRDKNSTCGVTDGSVEEAERHRERWERRQQRRRRRVQQRSVSKEKWVETLVVADPKMVDHHGSKAVESYVLAVMNIVAGLYRDPSIGNAINIVIVRVILLEKDEDELKITHHADNSLASFCKWQKKLNMKGDEHPLHHDVAVLLTRKDICTTVNLPCETLGLSHVAGMCQPHRSCSISEDTGLPLAFTVAHELGHNFGIQHDGNGNDCEPIGKRPFVMSPQLLYGTALPRWSRCSRQYITRFLDRGWGSCLDDPPVKDRLSMTSVPPGVLYSAVHQCRLQYGPASLLCDDVDNVCSTLWCTMGTTCHSKLDGAVDGTACGDNKWCYGGECVAVGHHPSSVHGGWGSWSEWSVCSRTCGAGVRSAERDCDSPVPKFRGRYCLGERRRYRICNTAPCASVLPSFRDLQCAHFNTLPYKGKLFKWESVINRVNPCELHCRPLKEHFSEKMRDAVADGTPCYQGNKSRDMCINGICQKIGCDYVVDSNAVEDRCGVCRGNGSTCTTVRKSFNQSEGLGYVDVGLIPEGAWDIRVEEVAEAGNFLALRSDADINRYFLNGGWTIQWNGEYEAGGAVFTYQRTGHRENLTCPGPTTELLWIQLLFQEANPGVRYEYTISQNVSEENADPVFSWKYGSWTECSVTCGAGVQQQIIHCVEKTTGLAEEHLCDPVTRPATNRTSCNKDACPAVWSVGEWQKCSASCGASGRTERAVLCVQAVSVDEKKSLNSSECQHIPKPESQSSCNTHVPCPADWTAGTWSKCSLTCGGGVRHRNVTCSRNTGVDCDPLKKPPAVSACSIQDCSDNFDWSGSGWSSKEVLNEIKPVTQAKPPPPLAKSSPPRSRGDPNDLNDLNDFHYHNSIEKAEESQENSVEVDDFYYDYNFINFHEDLSDEDAEDDRTLAPPPATPSPTGNEGTQTSRTPTPSPVSVSTQEPVSEDAGDVAMESEEASEEELDFLAEDDLLPVFTTRSPILSRPEENPLLRIPESTGAVPPRLVSTLAPPTRDGVKDDRLEEEDEEMETPTPIVTTDGPLETEDEHPDVDDPEYWDSEEPQTVAPEDLPSPPSPAPPFPLLLISGNLQASNAPDGAETGPPTGPPGAITLPPEPTIPTPSSTFESDYDEILLPPTPTSVAHSGTDFSTESEPIWPAPSAPTSTSGAAFWTAGNWSACSTSCGLGATWRPLACSTGSESDCDPAERPAPAQRCYLRPCATWRVGPWSKCSKDCDGGVKLREVQCFDLRDQRPLRPFHCRAVSSRPQTQLPCSLQSCLDWYTSSWGQCSEVCGGGEQQRIVTCPEAGRCDRELQPSNIQSCNGQPCAQWLTGSWGQCSAPCGGGLQHRLIQCVDTKAETDEEVEQSECDEQLQPESSRKCNVQECESAPSGVLLPRPPPCVSPDCSP